MPRCHDHGTSPRLIRSPNPGNRCRRCSRNTYPADRRGRRARSPAASWGGLDCGRPFSTPPPALPGRGQRPAAERHSPPAAEDGQTPEERLTALLHDLDALSAYLTERGRHTYELAQRFMEHARQDASSRAYDELQAVMLDYQHYLWMEIAGLVNKLLVKYGDEQEQ